LTPVLQRRLIRDAAAFYRPAGRFAEQFARGKFAGDPVFLALLRHSLLPDGARLVDLGCGQGLLAAWLTAARQRFDAGDWPEDWPAPPRLAHYLGVELMTADADRARRALGALRDTAAIRTGDLCTAEWPDADVVMLLDVLHFLNSSAQERLLERIRQSLTPAGVLLLRVGDRSGGTGFWWTQVVDYGVAWWRGHGFPRFHSRTRSDWEALLARLGFDCDSLPMRRFPIFANVLLIARPRIRGDR
jgi:SAM-dependent methyltransferase